MDNLVKNAVRGAERAAVSGYYIVFRTVGLRLNDKADLLPAGKPIAGG